MTTAQHRLYWREWAAARAAQPDLDRHWAHALALGYDKSHLSFTNDEFDKVLGQFRSVSRPVDIEPQLRAADGARRRLLHSIEHDYCARLALYVANSEDYIMRIVADRFHARALRDLTDLQLRQLRDTLAARVNTHRAEAGDTVAAMETKAAELSPA